MTKCHTRWDSRLGLCLGLCLGLALTLAGCSLDPAEVSRGDGGGEWDDSGPAAATDAGIPRFEADDGLGACFDARDNDDDGIFDCADIDCASAAVCCVGEATEACCVEGPPLAVLELAECPEGEAATCVSSEIALPFGDPPPRIEGRGLIGSGDELYESGLLLGAALDPESAILTLEATVEASTSCASAGCLDVITIGIIEPRELGDSPTLHPAAAMRINGSRKELELLIYGEVAARWDLSTVAPRRHILSLFPDGRVALRTEDPEGIEAAIERLPAEGGPRYQPPAEARAVVYGRTSGRDAGAGLPVRMRRLSVGRAACDMPQAHSREGGALLPAPGASWASDGTSVGSLSMAERRGEDGALIERRAVFELGGFFYEIELGEEGELGEEVDLGSPLLSGGVGLALGGIRDPELVADAERGRWVLYFTAIDEEGKPSLGRAVGEEGFLLRFSEGIEPLSVSSSLYDSFAQPAFVPPAPGSASPRELIVRASAQGSSHLALLREQPDGTFALAGEITRQGVLLSETTDSPYAFDRDELGAPAVLRDGGLLRIFYAGRRGTRWSVGMMVSADGLAHLRDPFEGEPLLVGSGEGFDALGVSHPTALRTDSGLWLYYAGTDGARWRIGRSRLGSEP